MKHYFCYFVLFFLMLNCYIPQNLFADQWIRARSLDKKPNVESIKVKAKLSDKNIIELDYKVPLPEIVTS